MQPPPVQPVTQSVMPPVAFRSPDDTAAFAAALAPLLGPGDTVLLAGPIGAGKSHFARSLIRARLAACGLCEDIPSPTFTLVQSYIAGPVEIWHADLYRLSGPAEVDELGLWEAFGAAICLVEWPDRLGDFAPAGALCLRLDPTEKAGQRRAAFSSADPRLAGRLARAGLGGGFGGGD